MKIAYVTVYDAGDVRNWSGLGYYISKCLRDQGISICYIGPLKDPFSLLLAFKRRFHRFFFRKVFLRNRTRLILNNYAKQVAKRLSRLDVDIVFSPGTIPISYLRCPQPIVFWTDATFGAMIDFYPDFSKLCSESIRNGNTMEQTALQNCNLAIYSSEWAAMSAIDLYGINSEKVKVIPFGANMECDRTLEDIKKLVAE